MADIKYTDFGSSLEGRVPECWVALVHWLQLQCPYRQTTITARIDEELQGRLVPNSCCYYRSRAWLQEHTECGYEWRDQVGIVDLDYQACSDWGTGTMVRLTTSAATIVLRSSISISHVSGRSFLFASVQSSSRTSTGWDRPSTISALRY